MKRSLLVVAIAMVSIAAVLPAWTDEAKKEEKRVEMEAVFCDHYNLDPDKYRAGKYQYDANTGKFIEKKE